MRTNNGKHILILLAILLLGFALRIYNINFPSIGYHNMKENDYLSIAQEMRSTNDYITRRIYFLNAFEEMPQLTLYPQPALISYQVLLLWKFLGENLWGPRLLNAIFGVLSILVLYFIALILFNDIRLSLFCAFLLAIMPLAVFFSRNIQPESPAFFFMTLGNLFYLRFVHLFKKRDLFLGSMAFSITGLYKLSFFIGIFPFIFCLPYKVLFKHIKESIKNLCIFILPYLFLLFVFIWLKNIGQWEYQEASRVNIWEVFTPVYWQKNGRTIWWYTKLENFTIVYVLLTLLGILIAFLKRRKLLDRYIIGWTLALIPYCMIFSDYINQHNYYQMPFLGLVCISSVYAVSYISELIKIREVPQKIFLLFLIAVTVGVSFPFAYNAIARMYGTVFFGTDVAGESLREFTLPGSRIFLLTHSQGRGSIGRYARRYVGWTDDFQDFKDKEKKFNISYICFYPAEYALNLKNTHPSLFGYIQENYHLKEVGLFEDMNRLFYIILERGKGSDPNTFLRSFSGNMQLKTIYKIFGKYYFFYTLRP